MPPKVEDKKDTQTQIRAQYDKNAKASIRSKFENDQKWKSGLDKLMTDKNISANSVAETFS